MSDLENFNPNDEVFVPKTTERVKHVFTKFLDPRLYVGAPVHFMDVSNIAVVGSQETYHCYRCNKVVDIGSLWEEVPEKEPLHFVTINHDEGTFYHACFGSENK